MSSDSPLGLHWYPQLFLAVPYVAHHRGECLITASRNERPGSLLGLLWHYPGWVKVGLLLQPGDGGSLGCALDLCWYGGGWAIVFKKYLSLVSNYFLQVFCLARLSYSWYAGWREQAFVGFSLSVTLPDAGFFSLHSGVCEGKRCRELTSRLFLRSRCLQPLFPLKLQSSEVSFVYDVQGF